MQAYVTVTTATRQSKSVYIHEQNTVVLVRALFSYLKVFNDKASKTETLDLCQRKPFFSHKETFDFKF